MVGVISVIVPVYNVEPYLNKCLDSILAQTYTDFEIICVDDGSTDHSGDTCDAYAERDSRVLVIHKENGGLVSARKTGLQAASGDYVAWVDGDDWIEPEYFEQMVEMRDQTKADIIAANLYLDRYHDSNKILNRISVGVYRYKEVLPNLIYAGAFFECGIQPHLVTKLIRTSILQQVQKTVDPRICMGEDAAFFYPSVLEAEKIAITNICNYHYIQRPNSITKRSNIDELERLHLHLNHLERAFQQAGVWEIMQPQMVQYQKYLLLVRQMPVLDRQVLWPYGGIPHHSRVVIYGAGVAGQQMYHYLCDSNLAEIVLWVDQNDGYYQKIGLPVNAPQAVRGVEGQYDYVLIANMSEPIANTIRKYLLELQVPEQKIRWLSADFIGSCSLDKHMW